MVQWEPSAVVWASDAAAVVLVVAVVGCWCCCCCYYKWWWFLSHSFGWPCSSWMKRMIRGAFNSSIVMIWCFVKTQSRLECSFNLFIFASMVGSATGGCQWNSLIFTRIRLSCFGAPSINRISEQLESASEKSTMKNWKHNWPPFPETIDSIAGPPNHQLIWKLQWNKSPSIEHEKNQ